MEIEKMNQENKAKKKGSVGNFFRSNKFKRGGMATLMSVVFIAIVVVVNVLVSALSNRFPSMNVDLTAEKLNSLSDQALEIAKGVQNDTDIYLIGDEEAIRKDRVFTSYNLKYSQVANLADKLQAVSYTHLDVYKRQSGGSGIP